MPAGKKIKGFLLGQPPKGPSPSPSQPAFSGRFGRVKTVFSRSREPSTVSSVPAPPAPSPPGPGAASSHALPAQPSIPAAISVASGASDPVFAPVALQPTSHSSLTDTQLPGDITAPSNVLSRSSIAASAHAAENESLNQKSPRTPVPVKSEAFEKAIQKFVDSLSDDDKAAFQSSSDIMERLQAMQCDQNSRISSALTMRVRKVLKCVRHFMGSIAILIQSNPKISALVVGGVNCILTVSSCSRTFY